MGQHSIIVATIVICVCICTNISAIPQADLRGSSLVKRLFDSKLGGALMDRSAIPSSITKDDMHKQIHNRGNSQGGLLRRGGPPPEDLNTEKNFIKLFFPNDPRVVKIFKSVKRQVLSYIKRHIMHTSNKLRVSHLVASYCKYGTQYVINFVIHQLARGSSRRVVPDSSKILCTAFVFKQKKKKALLRQVNCSKIPTEQESQSQSIGSGGSDGSGGSVGSVGSSGSAGGLSMGRRGSGASRGSGSAGELSMARRHEESHGSSGSSTVKPVTLRPLLSPTDPSVQRAFGTVSDNIKNIFVQYRKGTKPDSFQVNRRISATKRGSTDCAVKFNVREEDAKGPWNCLAEIANYEQVFFEIRLTRLNCEMSGGKRKFVATALGNSFEIKSH